MGLFEGDWIMDAEYKLAFQARPVRVKPSINLVYTGLEMNTFL